MSVSELASLVGAFALGALVAWALSGLLRGRREHDDLVEAARRVSAAEVTADTERARRREAETERDLAETRAAELDRALAVASERVDSAQRLVAEQQDFVASSRRQLEDSFRALASQALQGSSEQFLALAEQKLGSARTEATSDLDARKREIAALLEPLKETLRRLDTKTGQIEKERVDAYSRLDEQIRQLAKTTVSLQDKTTSLATALRGSEVRGRWGEIALRNIAELAGMSAHCDFEEQMTLEGGRRPDMTVRLPGNRRIAVDAKAPLQAYLDAMEAKDDATRAAKLDQHVRSLRAHVKALAGRDYARTLEADIDLVVMFLPGDPFLSAAFERDPDLQVDALRLKVLLATPSTLVALLRTVAIYWQQRSLAENAELIASTARELYERAAKFGEELGTVGRGLATALDAYNRAVGSFERRLVPMASRLDDLKVTEQTRREITAPEPVEKTVRPIRD